MKNCTNDSLVSVIIPAYRCEDTIAQAIDSALNQEVPVEVIVVNDCSPDGTEAVLQRYESDPRVKILRNERNSGVAFSRNRGIREAKGHWIALLDSDDWWSEGKLRSQLDVMSKGDVVLCSTGRELMNARGASTGRIISPPEKITYQNLLRFNCISCSSVLVRADVMREFPMERDDAHEDYILWLKILKKYGEAVGISDAYLKYRVSQSSKSGNKWKSSKMRYKVYRYLGYRPLTSVVFCIVYVAYGLWNYYGRNK